MQEFIGTGVALVTPFKEDKSIDFLALEKLVDFNVSNGVEYLVVNGTTGESATISKEERNQILEVVVATNNKRVPIVLGIGGNNTAAVVKEIQSEDLDHIDAILSVAPYYNKPTQEGFYQHFKAIAMASPKPIILYNVPGRTAKNMEPETTLRLANDFENIIAIKEASGDMSQAELLIKKCPAHVQVISGEDALNLPMLLAGAVGTISVLGNALPVPIVRMFHYVAEGNLKKAYEFFEK